MKKQRMIKMMSAAAAAAVIALTGCGNDGSSIGSRLSAPALTTAAGPQATDASEGGNSIGSPSSDVVPPITPPAGGEDPAPTGNSAPGVQVDSTGQVVETTLLVPRHVGGTIVAGRFKLIIKNKDLAQDTIITLRDISGMTGRVECEILPAGLAFGKHVQLIASFSDLMPEAGCSFFSIANSGAPDESWSLLGGLPTDLGLAVHLTTTGDFAPSVNP